MDANNLCVYEITTNKRERESIHFIISMLFFSSVVVVVISQSSISLYTNVHALVAFTSNRMLIFDFFVWVYFSIGNAFAESTQIKYQIELAEIAVRSNTKIHKHGYIHNIYYALDKTKANICPTNVEESTAGVIL